MTRPESQPGTDGPGASRPASAGSPDTELFRWSGLRVGVLSNSAAGQSVRTGGGAESVAGRVLAALTSMDAVVPDDFPEGIPQQMERVRTDRPDVIVAVGGDGTINAGARVAIDVGAPLLIVPTGTMNLTAKDLCIPIDVDRQLTTLHRLVRRDIDFAAVNGEVFLHSSAIGFIPRLAAIREELRASDSFGDWVRNASRFVRGVLTAGANRVRLRSDNGGAQRRTRSVLVSCNPLADGGVGHHRRAPLDGGRLGVYASRHTGPLGSVGLFVTLAMGRVARDTETDCGACTALEVETGRPTITVSNDGELAELDAPLAYTISPRGLTVLVDVDSLDSIAFAPLTS